MYPACKRPSEALQMALIDHLSYFIQPAYVVPSINVNQARSVLVKHEI